MHPEVLTANGQLLRDKDIRELSGWRTSDSFRSIPNVQ